MAAALISIAGLAVVAFFIVGVARRRSKSEESTARSTPDNPPDFLDSEDHSDLIATPPTTPEWDAYVIAGSAESPPANGNYRFAQSDPVLIRIVDFDPSIAAESRATITDTIVSTEI